jgi:hypothetical protein
MLEHQDIRATLHYHNSVGKPPCFRLIYPCLSQWLPRDPVVPSICSLQHRLEYRNAEVTASLGGLFAAR